MSKMLDIYSCLQCTCSFNDISDGEEHCHKLKDKIIPSNVEILPDCPLPDSYWTDERVVEFLIFFINSK